MNVPTPKSPTNQVCMSQVRVYGCVDIIRFTS